MVLEYIPGCDRPVGVDPWADGRWQEGDVPALLGDPEVRNQPVWGSFVAVEAEMPELARWGHWVPGMPWE